MQKPAYLALPDVDAFVTWLHTNEAGFLFTYSGPRHAMHACGLDGAATAYHWNGQSLAGATAHLIGLRRSLRQTLSAGNSTAHLDECVEVLRWGDVVRTNDIFYQTLHNARDLINYHRAAHGPKGWYHAAIADDATAPCTVQRISAGTTKVHSLLEDELLIYDSRVAAAMGWLVERFCDQQLSRVVPQCLHFCLPTPRPGTNRIPEATRTPLFQDRVPTRYAQVTAANPGNWVRDSLRASWITSALLERRVVAPAARPLAYLRLQLGLFMVGYDISNHQVDGCSVD
jgi:hypothetical protein